jgi:hypothetical protein
MGEQLWLNADREPTRVSILIAMNRVPMAVLAVSNLFGVGW